MFPAVQLYSLLAAAVALVSIATALVNQDKIKMDLFLIGMVQSAFWLSITHIGIEVLAQLRISAENGMWGEAGNLLFHLIVLSLITWGVLIILTRISNLRSRATSTVQ